MYSTVYVYQQDKKGIVVATEMTNLTYLKGNWLADLPYDSNNIIGSVDGIVTNSHNSKDFFQPNPGFVINLQVDAENLGSNFTDIFFFGKDNGSLAFYDGNSLLRFYKSNEKINDLSPTQTS